MLTMIQNFITQHKKTLVNLLFYFFASSVPMLLNIGTMPVFSYFLSPEDFAVIGFYNSLSILFGPLISFYLLHNYMRSFFRNNESDRERLYATTAQLLVYLSAILAGISIVMIFIYQTYFNKKSQIGVMPYAFYAMFYLAEIGLLNLKLTRLKMEKKSLPYFIYGSLNSVLTVGFSILFVVLGGGCTGKLEGIFFGGLFLFLYLFWETRHYLFQKIRLKLAWDILVFCFPLMIAAMLGFFSNGYDKVFLEQNISMKELGYYSVGVSISHFLYVFSDAITSTFSSDIYESIAKKDFKRCMRFVLLKLFLITIIVIPFVLFAPLLVNLLTAYRYKEAIPFCVITAFSAITGSLYYSSSQVIIASNHNHIPLLTRIIGSILTIGMFYILIKKWGAYGAAYGNVLNFLIYLFCNLLFLGITVLSARRKMRGCNVCS